MSDFGEDTNAILRSIEKGIDTLAKASTMTRQERAEAERRAREAKVEARESDGTHQVRCRG